MLRVGLFIPCYVDQLAPHVGLATAELLEHYGCEVDFPTAQACCGQPFSNMGCPEDARPLALRFAKAFPADRYDHVVAPSASCVAMVRHHYRGLARNERERALLDDVAGRTCELCEFLVDVLDVPTATGRYAKRVGLHRGCHGLRELRLGGASERMAPGFDKVERLLAGIDGVEFASLDRPDECCGFGGTFTVDEPVISAEMGRDRLADHARNGAEVIVSTDVSCSLHLDSLARASEPRVPIVHVAELINEARKASEEGG